MLTHCDTVEVLSDLNLLKVLKLLLLITASLAGLVLLLFF